MTARVPDGEQPVGGEGRIRGQLRAASERAAALPPHARPTVTRPRPAEPTVDGLAELEALRAVVARVEALADELDKVAAMNDESARMSWVGSAHGARHTGLRDASADAVRRIREALRGD